MSEDPRENPTPLIPDTYFEEARRWYDVKYLSPISERVYFIVVTVLAGFIVLFAIIGLSGLMPLKPARPFVYLAQDINNKIPRMETIRQNGEPKQAALLRFYVEQYVESREHFSEKRFLPNANFVKQHSEPSLYAEYVRLNDPSNPRSPAAQYQKHSTRQITVEQVLLDGEPETSAAAKVRFTASVTGPQGIQKTVWTASLTFAYSALVETEVKDPSTGEVTLDLKAPTFRVLRYEAREGAQSDS